ncbi:hypothetical protein TanjilG_09556 [Lupinus angustifolius]|uniref:Uncharacterized protein n=1 Tax=Lupinus angustifolius TaxID=3871 RepID=A0A1J7GCE2_LUPAN|nr:hypothetical protein TanjilG_09556 [Lupinus angustifolius]
MFTKSISHLIPQIKHYRHKIFSIILSNSQSSLSHYKMTNYNHQHALLLLLFLFLISSSSARLLNGDISHAATKTTLNIALPNSGKYMPLILNMLPKGKVPSSGPSKRVNNFNN